MEDGKLFYTGSDYRISYEAGTLTVFSEDYPFVPTPRPDPKPSTPQWVQDGNGWKYQNASGSYLKDQWKYLSSDRGTSAWYWFDEAGYAATGWRRYGYRLAAGKRQLVLPEVLGRHGHRLAAP